MLRARFPLAVALLAATLVIPATAASAADDPITSAVTTASPSASPSATDSGVSSSATNESGGTESSGTTTTPSRSSSGGATAAADCDGLAFPQNVICQIQNAGESGGGSEESPFAQYQQQFEDIVSQLSEFDSSGLGDALQGFGDCLQTASGNTDPTAGLAAGEACFIDLLTELGLPTECFTDNNLTLTDALAKVEDALAGNPPDQADFEQFLTDLQDALGCLASQSSEPEPTASSGGGGTGAPAPTATSNEAPAAVAVVGTPNFTG